MPTIRMEIVRAIVTYVSLPNRKYDQSLTLARLRTTNPTMRNTLVSNLSIIQREKQKIKEVQEEPKSILPNNKETHEKSKSTLPSSEEPEDYAIL